MEKRGNLTDLVTFVLTGLLTVPSIRILMVITGVSNRLGSADFEWAAIAFGSVTAGVLIGIVGFNRGARDFWEAFREAMSLWVLAALAGPATFGLIVLYITSSLPGGDGLLNFLAPFSWDAQVSGVFAFSGAIAGLLAWVYSVTRQAS